MSVKYSVLGLLAGSLLLTTASPVLAADNCDFDGQIAISGSAWKRERPGVAPGADKVIGALSGYGSATVNYHCGEYNFQVGVKGDKTLPWKVNTGTSVETLNNVWGEGEAAVFMRDPQKYALGLAISRSLNLTHIDRDTSGTMTKFDIYSNDWNGTVFGELYPDENITLGLSGTLTTGELIDGFTIAHRGFGVTGFARYYVSPNFRVGVTAGLDSDTWAYPSYIESGRTLRGKLNAEYKFEDSPFSIYSNLTTTRNEYTYDDGSPSFHNTNVIGTVGFTFNFGANANKSLVESDRNGVW